MTARLRHPQPRSDPAIAREDAELQLRHEDIYDRRWARHRDQMLTITGIVGVVLAAVLSIPALVLVGALPAGPRAAKWFFDHVR